MQTQEGRAGSEEKDSTPLWLPPLILSPYQCSTDPLCLLLSGWDRFDLTVVSLPGLSLVLFSTHSCRFLERNRPNLSFYSRDNLKLTHAHPLTCVLFIITHSLLCVPTPNLFGHRRVLVSCSVALIWKTRRHSAFGVSGWRSSLFLCDKNRLFWQLARLHLFPHFPSHLGQMHRWKNTFYKACDWNNTWTFWSTLIRILQ